jgi:hypothetical protein
MVLLHTIEDGIMHQTCHNHVISLVNQLLVAFQYYVTGAFQVYLMDNYLT